MVLDSAAHDKDPGGATTDVAAVNSLVAQSVALSSKSGLNSPLKALSTPASAPESNAAGQYSAAQFAGDVLRTAAYTAVASPVEAVMQIADQARGTHLQAGTSDFFARFGVTAPQSDATGAKWLAQTIGQAGIVVPMLLLRKPVGAIMADSGAALVSERTALGFTLRESALTGLLQGSLLTPTDDKGGFIHGRIAKGLDTSAQFVGMTAASLGVGRIAESGVAFKYGLNRALSNHVVSGVISGVPGGLIAAQLDALEQGRKLPTGSELGQSVLSMSLLGGLFGAHRLASETLALKPSLNDQSRGLLTHPDVQAVLRAPRPDLAPHDYLSKLPGADLSLPAPTGPWLATTNGRVAPWQSGDMTRGPGRAITVQDDASGVSRQYVGDRLITARARPQDASHTYAYNAEGDLRAIVTGANQGWFKTREGWAQGRIDKDSGRLALYPTQAAAATLTADGVMLSQGKTAWSLPVTARFLSANADGAALTHTDINREKALTDYLAAKTVPPPEAAGSPPQVHYFSEDGTELTLSSQLQAFRDAAQKHGLKFGSGQVEAEVGRSLAAGNEAEALSLLVAAQKLMPRQGVNTLKTSRTPDGALHMVAEGFTGGDHMRYFLDGTVIKTGQNMRTTSYADGSKLEDFFLDGSKTKINSSGAIEQISNKTRAGQLVQDIAYTPDAKVSAIAFELNGHKASLNEVDGRWRITVDMGTSAKIGSGGNADTNTKANNGIITDKSANRPSTAASPDSAPAREERQMTVDLGPGTVEARQVLGAYFKGEDNSAVIAELDGKLTLNGRKQRLDFTPGQPLRISEADMSAESARQTELSQRNLTTAAEREQFAAATKQFDSEAQNGSFMPATKAVLMAEVNDMLERRPAQAADLMQLITKLASTLPEQRGRDPAVLVDKTPDSTSIYIGNKVIDIDSKGNFAQRQSPLLRFDGVTGGQFRADVTKAAANDISPSIAKLLSVNNVAVIGTPTIAQAFPEFSMKQPTGWPSGTSGKSLGALYNPEARRIAVAQNQVSYLRGNNPTMPTQDPGLDMLRAVGSAVDDITKISKSEQFKNAFEADEKNLKEPDAVKFYRGKDQSANFSVLFADLFTGTQVENPQATLLRKYFPQTAALVDQSIRSIAGREESLKMSRPEAPGGSPSAPDDHPMIPDLGLQNQPIIQERIASAVGQTPVYPQFMRRQLTHDKVDAARAEIDSLLTGKTQPASHQTLTKNSDGTVELIDSIALTRRLFDQKGKMLSAERLATGADAKAPEIARSAQHYLYDQDGSLKAAFQGDHTGYIHSPEGWLKATLSQDNNQFNLRPIGLNSVTVHPAGGMLIGRDAFGLSQMVNGRTGSFEESGFELNNTSLSYEKSALEGTIDRLGGLQAPGLHGTLDQFLRVSAKQHITADHQGSLMLAFSEAIADDPVKGQALLGAVTKQIILTPNAAVSYERTADGRTVVGLQAQRTKYLFYNNGDTGKEVRTSYGKDTTMQDSQGRLLSQKFEPNSDVTRSVENSEKGLISVRDNLIDGSTYTVSQQGKDYVRVVKKADGTEQKLNLGPGTLTVDRTNEIVFTPADPTQPQFVHNNFNYDTLRHNDGRVENLQYNGRKDFVSADLSSERNLLRQNIRASMGGDKADAPARIERFEKLLDQYLQSGPESAAAAARGTKALVLLQLNRLLSANSSAAFSLPARADLAEQLLSHTMDPVKIWQGAHQTCNVATVEHRLMVQAPDRVIGLVADLTVNGSYTRTDGRQFTTDSLVGVHSADTEAASNLKRQTDPRGSVTSDLGERDWASQIAQTALLRAAWMDMEVYLAGNQILPNQTVALVANHDTGKLQPVKVDPASIKALDVRNGNAEVIYDLKGNIIGNVKSSDYMPLRDRQGQWLEKLKPGDTGYDGYGRPLVHRAGEHEIGFGKNFLKEDVLVSLLDGQQTPLIDADHDLLDTPLMQVTDIANAYAAVDNDGYKPANIIAFNNADSNVTNVASEIDLVKLAHDLGQSSQLPAIMLVHTRNQAFGHWQGGGFHVVNLYEPTQGGKTLRYSNQWGAAQDGMGTGQYANLLFAAMKPPSDLPNMPQIVVPLPKVGVSSSQVNAPASPGASMNISASSSSPSSYRSLSSWLHDTSSGPTGLGSLWLKDRSWLNFLNSKD